MTSNNPERVIHEAYFPNTKSPYTLDEIKPVIWGCDFIKAKQKVAAFKNGSTPIHPLDVGRYLFYASLEYKSDKSRYKKVVHNYLSLIRQLEKDSTYFRGNTFRYNFAHKEIPAGWWSGMANSALILGLSYSSELRGSNTKIIDKLIQNLQQDYSLGGCSQTDEYGNKWMLEYAWDGMNENEIKYVLNGFLFSVLCVALAEKVYPDSRLKEIAQSGLERYKRVRRQFHFETLSWTKYDLHHTIEPPHYAIFDLILLKSLVQIFPNERDWILEETQIRQNILKKSYGFDRTTNGDEQILLFNLLGAPSPYLIDIYPIRMDLNFSDKALDSTIASMPPEDFSKKISKRGFLEISLSRKQYNALQNISVYSVYAGLEMEIFSIDKIEIRPIAEEDNAQDIYSDLNTYYDASLEGGTIKINPEDNTFANQETYRNEIGQITWDFKDSVNLREHQNIVIKAKLDASITSHKFYLYQNDGTISERYYIPLEAGPNIIVLNPVGFKDYKIDRNIKRLAWRIYTNNMKGDLDITVEGVYLAKNNFQLKNLLEDSTYYFKEKGQEGNIY